MPDSAVLTLREEMPSADSCGDLYLQKPIDGLLPVGCGAEAVFNFSWEKKIDQYGSGDDDDDDDNDLTWSTTMGTTIIPTRTLLSTTTRHRSIPTAAVSVVSAATNRSAPRLPPRFTPSLESRHSSFQHLLRLHMNTFNQRLSMLERNTLDMKESIQHMEDQQKHLNSQLTELISFHLAGEKNKKVNELEKSYTDMEARLSRLEGRLEILIDGFTALAQEMNKMKRARHASRSAQERRALPSLATDLALPLYTTTHPPVRIIPTEAQFTSRATVPKSIPTPGLPADKLTSAPRRQRKLKSAGTTTSLKNTTQLQSVSRHRKSQVTTRSVIKLTSTVTKPMSTSKSTAQTPARPETKKPESKRSTATAKRVSKQSNAKASKEVTVTKFQLEPPPHKSKAARSDQARGKNPAKRKGGNKAFRADAPVPKKVQEDEGHSNELSAPHNGNSNQKEKKAERNSPNTLSHKTKKTITTTKPTKTTKVKKSNTTGKSKTTSQKTKVTTVKKKSNITGRRKPTSPKPKASTTKQVAKKKQQKNSPVLDLLQLLNGDQMPAKQKKNRDTSLHVVLGRLAIPIKIIPDY